MDEVYWNAGLLNSHPPSATVPPLPEGEGYFLDDGFCDSAFGSAQNDNIGGDI